MKIRQAMICLECDEVSTVMTHCPVCLSAKVTPLANWIPPKEAALPSHDKVVNLRSEIDRFRRKTIEMATDIGLDEEPLGIGA